MSNITSAQMTQVLSTMNSEVGKPYSENIPGRFGPNEFDCSGLIWYAFNKAGIPMPGGPSDDAAAIVDPELQWLASQPGSQVITDKSQIQAGDVLGFVGADPNTYGTAKVVNGKLSLGNTSVNSMGHIGMAVNNSTYVSAYDTADGVTTKPISGDVFVAAVRPASGVTSSTPASDDGSGGILSWPSEITGFFSDANTFVTTLMWITKPGNWVRIIAVLAGVALLLFAIHAFIAAANGEPLVQAPKVVPIPV